MTGYDVSLARPAPWPTISRSLCSCRCSLNAQDEYHKCRVTGNLYFWGITYLQSAYPDALIDLYPNLSLVQALPIVSPIGSHTTRAFIAAGVLEDIRQRAEGLCQARLWPERRTAEADRWPPSVYSHAVIIVQA